MADVTPNIARDFYRAAARFYRESPWRSVGSDEPIKVRSGQIEGGPRFAIVLGRKSDVKGLWLCDDWKTCVLVERGRYEMIADHLRYTALHFGGRTEISPDDLEKIRRHGFEVAGPTAFPSVLRKEPGEDFRNPDAGELEHLEACLWVIPDFLRRAEDRKPDVYEYAFKATECRMSLDCAGCRRSGWVWTIPEGKHDRGHRVREERPAGEPANLRAGPADLRIHPAWGREICHRHGEA
jgi:hypothetical protein